MSTLEVIAFRAVVLLMNALVIHQASRLTQPHSPLLTPANAVGVSLFLWIAGTEFRSRIN
jgi:hypothetical protein